MLTQEQINTNKERFISLISSINRDNSDIEGLLNYLKQTGYFEAPASTQYHSSYKGGLCDHDLKVYDILLHLTSTYAPDKYNLDTIKIIGLLHDVFKSTFYEQYIKNEKVYSSSGSKYDEMGKYDWIASKNFKVKDSKQRLLLGSKGFNSYYIVSSFIPLSQEETVAFVNQYSANDLNENTTDLLPILHKYNLSVYLHSADIISSYCIEDDK